METTKQVTWSVGRKLGAGFSAMVFLALVVGVVGLVAMNTVSQEVQNSTVQVDLSDLADEIQINLLEGRKVFRDFLLSYQKEGIEQAKKEYITQVDSFIKQLEIYADKGNKAAKTEENRQHFLQIEQGAAKYNTALQTLLNNVDQRGTRISGIERQLIETSTRFQDTVQTFGLNELTIATFKIREYGRDYRLYHQEADFQKISEGVKEFKQTVTDLPDRQLSADDKAKFLKQADDYMEMYHQFYQIELQIETNRQQLVIIADELDTLIKNIVQKSDELYLVAIANTDQTITGASTLELVVLGVVVLVGIAIAYGLSRNISYPVSLLTETVTLVAQGNLKQRTEVVSRDELGLLAQSFNQMADNIQQLVESQQQTKNYLEQTVNDYVTFVGQVSKGNLVARLTLNGKDDPMTVLGHNLNQMVEQLSDITFQIRQATSSLSSASTEILSATMQQVSGANEQSAAITQTTSTITEVKTVVEQSFNKAEAVAKASYRSNEISQNGQKAVTEAIEGMRQIKEKVAGIAENILALSEQTQRIGEITATVNEIAAQSNLLALNASVEAARAGEHGKGFAVVAVEVRNLAEQSKQATSQVKAILNEIQQATNAAVMATEEGTKGVDAGVALTQETGSTINILTQSIAESASTAQQIVASSKQQSAGMEQISLAMQNINQATVQSLASTRQTERSAQDLSALAKQLDMLVARYKLN